MTNISKRSEAQKRADKKYKQKYEKERMSQIGVSVNKPERAVYEDTAARYNIPLSQFMRRCAVYCINNNIDISAVEINVQDLTRDERN